MKKKIIFTLVLLISIVSACDEGMLDIKNQSQYSDVTYFREAPQFNEAVIATYATLLQNGLYSRDAYFIFDLLGHDATNNIFLLGDLAQLQDYSFGAAQPQLTDLWKSLYRMIFRANLVLSKAAEWDPPLPSDQALKGQYVGEAYFLRGYAYFMLVNLWGRVPLKLDYAEQLTDAPRAESTAAVWNVVEQDFSAAIDALPVSYPTADRGRATKGAAIAMLGKSYLYQKKYAEAEGEFEKLLTAPFSYTLNPSYDDQFTEANNNSPETIFDVPHRWQDWGVGNQYYMFGGQEAWGGQATHTGRAMEYGWNDWNNVFVSDALVKAFKYKDESDDDYTDPRAALVFYGDAASGGDTDFCHTCTKAEKGGEIQDVYAPDPEAHGPYPYPFGASSTIRYNWRKYEYYETLEFYGGPESNINTQIIRFADVLLMLAEAYIEQNKVADARPLINQVRSRVGAFEYADLGSQDNARTILRRERQLELAGEQSRWFDLVRWGIAKEVLNAEKMEQLGKQPFQDKHILFPIPQIERTTNPAIADDVANDWN
jgi:hypothetical protein